MPSKNSIIVLHKSGAPSHYRALELLAQNSGYSILYREFSIFSKLLKSLFRLNFPLFNKQVINLKTLISLYFTSGKKVVLGIAPYDPKLKIIARVLNGHHIYYHTSWPIWDGTDYPKRKNVTRNVKLSWKDFLENETKHIFAVTETAKLSIKQNYTISVPITVVGHSFDPEIFHPVKKVKRNFKACYAGRLVSQKGIRPLLEWSLGHPDHAIAFMGSGELISDVIIAAENSHVTFIPSSVNTRQVSHLFQKSDYLIVNAIKTSKWQELFGMVIIEAMACGCIPITTDHVGPLELIDHNVDGFIFSENTLLEKLSSIIRNPPTNTMKQAATDKASNFTIQQISKKWRPILTHVAND